MNKYLLNFIGVSVLALVATSTWAVWEWGGVGQTTKTSVPALVQKMDKILSKADELDMKKVDASLQNVSVMTHNLSVASRDVSVVTSHVRENLPLIDGAVSLLWQHVDNTVGHLDVATLAEQDQQKEIAALTSQNLRASKLALDDLDGVITDPNIPLAVSHITQAAQSVQGMADDGKAVADYYKKILTAPKHWWSHVLNILETAYYGRGAIGR